MHWPANSKAFVLSEAISTYSLKRSFWKSAHLLNQPPPLDHVSLAHLPSIKLWDRTCYSRVTGRELKIKWMRDLADVILAVCGRGGNRTQLLQVLGLWTIGQSSPRLDLFLRTNTDLLLLAVEGSWRKQHKIALSCVLLVTADKRTRSSVWEDCSQRTWKW